MSYGELKKEEQTMGFRKIVILLLVIFGPLLPIALEAQSPGGPGAPDMIMEEEVRQFIDKYVDRYKAKDLDLYMELYSGKSVENRMLSYADIRSQYQKVFAESDQLLYQITLYSVQTRGQRAFVTGRYKAIQTLKGGNMMRTFRGNIQWDLIRENGFLKVREINYGVSRGAY